MKIATVILMVQTIVKMAFVHVTTLDNVLVSMIILMVYNVMHALLAIQIFLIVMNVILTIITKIIINLLLVNPVVVTVMDQLIHNV